MSKPILHRGRFAPTPSGPLHLGSLLTALASYLQAKSKGGVWLLRMDDLDGPRCMPGAADQIRRQLEGHGLLWDESIRWQSQHVEEYRTALQSLERSGRVYPCSCTRARLEVTSLAGPDGPVYPGTCRAGAKSDRNTNLRLRVDDDEFGFEDGWQGAQRRNLLHDVGDFVVRRADGVIGYQLACAVDESTQGITEVTRGADLLGSTIRQLVVMEALRIEPPDYRHLPVLIDSEGRKLSKQNHAAPVQIQHAAANLLQCLRYLNQLVPQESSTSSPQMLVEWAVANWDPVRVPNAPSMTTPGFGAVQHPGYNAAQHSEEWLQ